MQGRSWMLVCLVPLLIAAGVAVHHFGTLDERSKPQAAASPEQQTPQPTLLPPSPSNSPVRISLARPRLLETGAGFHGAEVNARSSETWLGLYATESNSELLELTLKIKLVHDPIVDEDEVSATGKSVSVNHPLEPLLLVKDVPGLRPGPVTTIFHVAPLEFYSLSKHSTVSLNLGTQAYQLKLLGRPSGENSVLPRDPQLWLTDGTTKQLLFSLAGEIGDADWSLQWAGDLDGDGKLDLYTELNPHYNVSARKLFLSSHAKPGQLVAKVAEFVTTGC